MKRFGQSWSMDVVLAVVVFGFITVTFTSFALLDSSNVDALEREAQLVAGGLANPLMMCNDLPVLRDGSLDQNTTACLFGQDYEDLQQLFQTSQDFCMYLEDQDGNVIPVRLNDGTTQRSIGSPDVIVGGLPCGQ